MSELQTNDIRIEPGREFGIRDRKMRFVEIHERMPNVLGCFGKTSRAERGSMFPLVPAL